MGYTGFHGEVRTPIEQEISLAESLCIACKMRYGDKVTRMLRTDPAKVCSMMRYARLQFDSGEFYVWQGNGYGRDLGFRRPTNDEILTPSHSLWPEFNERLGAELMRPDFDFWYAPRRFQTTVGVTSDMWPLCSAQLIGELGCAIGETLCVLASFYCHSDQSIHDNVEDIWHRVKPHSRRRAFDADDAMDARSNGIDAAVDE
jgi:hypothetical protein